MDTLIDEKFEAVKAAEAIDGGLRLCGLIPRLNRLMEEVKWELDIRGFGDVKI